MIDKSNIDFFIKIYLPELRKVTKNVHIGLIQKLNLSRKFVGMAMKIGYSFLWQEYRVPYYISVLYSKYPMGIGAAFAPYFNRISNLIGGFTESNDENINSAKGVYPGDVQCRGYSPHALWHEEGAQGFYELVLVTDYVN